MPPVAPMLAKATDAVPEGEGWQFEPKWDGFRCIVFRDGDDIVLGSRNERPLTRYFPELIGPMCDEFPERVVIDGELVIATPDGLDFDALQQRIHPAESRIKKLAAETPATFVVFDLLADDRGKDLTGLTLRERREKLEAFAAKYLAPQATRLPISPVTLDVDVAKRWLTKGL